MAAAFDEQPAMPANAEQDRSGMGSTRTRWLGNARQAQPLRNSATDSER